MFLQSADFGRRMKKAPSQGLKSSFFTGFSKAEGMGFEPTTPFGASDFESDRHLVFHGLNSVFFGLLTLCAR